MQTRRSSKATAAAPSSPPALRRNPPRATRRQENQDVGGDSSSGLSFPLSGPSAILQESPASPSPSRPSGARPSSTSPADPSASIPPPNASPALTAVPLPKGLTSVPRKGSLVWDPPPRRGAPRLPSGSSVRISPDRESDDEPPTPIIPKSEAELLKEKMVQCEIEDAEHQLMIEAIDSLARDARNVIDQLQNKTRPSYKEVLSRKMQAFKASRNTFLAPGQASPFLRYDWLHKTRIEISDTMRVTVPLAIKLANIATALSHIESIESGARASKAFLDALDASFPRHFAAEEDKQYLSLSLEIRTQRAIERIVSSADNIDKRTELSWVFCPTEPGAAQAPKGGYPELFKKGPYRALAGLEPEALVNVCSDRVQDMWRIMSDDGSRAFRSPMNLTDLRKQFPLNNMIAHLKNWLMNRFKSISLSMAKIKREEEKRLLEQLRKKEEEKRPALEEERRAIEEERRVIEEERRAKEQRLRAREKALAQEERRRRAQEQERHGSEPEAREARALSSNAGEGSWTPQQGSRESSPESVQSSQDEPSPRRLQGNSRSLFSSRDMVSMLNTSSLKEQSISEASRKRSTQSDPHEIQSDNDFEPGPRPNKKAKAATSSAPVQPRQAQQTREKPPPAAPSSATDLAALRHAKEMNVRAGRLDQPRPHQKRHPWSEKDSNTLIGLVAQHGCAWADLYKTHRASFDHPRNAQAYRDKARNLKVDFLLADAPLPLKFDGVALSQKEVDKVVNAGKNPYRLECHVDEYGRPTDTEYVP